jgi:hypothetical protein
MPEFQLPVMRISKRRYNVLVWRYDDGDRNAPLRVYLRMHPEMQQWFSDNQVEYSVTYSRLKVAEWGRDWRYHYTVIIENPNQAMLFKLTWDSVPHSTTLGFV